MSTEPPPLPPSIPRRWLKPTLALLLLMAGGLSYYRLTTNNLLWNNGNSLESTSHRPHGSSGKGSQNPSQTGKANRPQPVTIAEVAIRDIPLWLPAIGTAIPRNLVIVRSRVDGELRQVFFEEGQTVYQGQRLAEIDPRSFQAQLTQANGQLARDTAQLKNAQADLARYRNLQSRDSIARQQLDTQAALVRQYQGAVENDQGLVENAKLQLSYTHITAPLTGRVGLRQVDPGNQVRATDSNGLISIAQVKPMTVVFTIPESHWPELNHYLEKGDKLPVEAWDREQKNCLALGRLLTTDNQIDLTTGTLKLKAEFTNDDNRLFPNQFVAVRLQLGVKQGTLVVPKAAVLRGSQGSYVYRVDDKGLAQAVTVIPGPQEGEWQAIDGLLTPGQRVVLEGTDKLKDGVKIEVITAGAVP